MYATLKIDIWYDWWTI